MEFCKAFNARTQAQPGMIIPVIITVYADRSFTFITKTPPASVLLKKAAGVEKGAADPKRGKVGQGDARAGARDRRAQAARPDGRVARGGDAHDRGHGAQRRPRRRRLRVGRMAQHRKATEERDWPGGSRARAMRSTRRWRLAAKLATAKFDETRRARRAPRRRSAAGRPERARHRRAAARHRHVGARRGLRQGREGARGARRPAPTSSAARTW